MGLDLNHGWLDSRRLIDGQQFIQSDIRKADGPALAMVHEIFHRSPGIEQSHALVINHIAVLIARVLFIAGLKCIGSVNEVEIEILDPEPVETRLESRFDTFGPVIGVPQLCSDENVFTRDSIRRKSLL